MKKRLLCAFLALLGLSSIAFAEGSHPALARPLAPKDAASGGQGALSVQLLSQASRIRDFPVETGLSVAGLLMEGKSVYLSLNFPFPLQWEYFGESRAAYGQDSAFTWGWGVGLDVSAFFTRRCGFHFSFDACFPQSQTAYGGARRSETYGIGDYWDSAWGLSFFLGPSLALIRNERVLLAVAPGVHVSALFAENLLFSTARGMFGLGGSVEFAFIFARYFFVRAAVDITFDFIGIEKDRRLGASSSSVEIDSNALNVVPSVGVGIWL